MHSKRLLPLFFILTAFLSNSCDSDRITDIHQAKPSEFVHARGSQLFINDTVVQLRGTCIGNNIWQEDPWPVTDHVEEDFSRIRNLGMNAVRFYLTWKTLESQDTPYLYDGPGWEWIDTNIIWARNNDVFLILNIHIPQGGYQSNGEGFALWDNPENGNRFKAMWREIASRYKDESIIAGYSILNEPYVSRSVDQWKQLAQETVNEIRAVDSNHLIIVERLINEGNGSEHYDDPSYTQFTVNDPFSNMMYEFHYYYPFEFTHQLINKSFPQEKRTYPDSTNVQYPFDLEFSTGTFENPQITSGNSDWVYLDGDETRFHVDDSTLLCAKPAFIADYIEEGKVYFGSFTVKEYDETDEFTRVVLSDTIRSAEDWMFWSQDGSGSFGYSPHGLVETAGSVFITGTGGYADTYNNSHRFPVRHKYHYSISGWIKGDNIPENSKCQFRLNFEKSRSGEQITYLDKKYLERQLTKFLKFGADNNVPMYVGEFGLNFEECGSRGGIKWMKDMLELLDNHKVNWTHHIYHGYWFGMYTGNGRPPSEEQTELVEVFRDHFNL